MKTLVSFAMSLAISLECMAVSSFAASNEPMIDYTHDRVQTTLETGLKRIGTIMPRGAREVGRSNLTIGCEMLDRDYGDFEQFKA